MGMLGVALVACSGAYGEAVRMGDKLASEGLWQDAVASYERAVVIDPQNPEAVLKLKTARRQLGAERLAKGKALVARGELARGLEAVQDAARLDAESAEAQEALADTNARVVDRARALLEEGKGKEALDLTSLVLRGSPNDPRGRELDARVRERLAEESYSRGMAFFDKRKLGNALVELAACVSYKPAFRDAKARLGQTRAALIDELMFFVVLDKFADGGGSRDMALALQPELVGQALDERLPIRVVAKITEKSGAHGVHLWGTFDGYRFEHAVNKVGRTCDYVCGTDTQPNPEYENAERNVASAEQRLARAEEELARVQPDVDRAQQDVDRVQKDVESARADADKARDELDRCRARSPSSASSSACSSEDSRLRSAQSSLESVRQRLSSPRSSLDSARDRVSRGQQSREQARRDKDRELERMRATARTIQVDRHCAHDYSVDVHTLSASVRVTLNGEALLDRGRVLRDEVFPYEVRHRDETFEAQRGRCTEVAQGKGLALPTEKQVRLELVNQTITSMREKVVMSFEGYRQRFLADARRQEAGGLGDEAVESYVRFLLTGPRTIKAEEEREMKVLLERTRGFGQIGDLGSL